MAFQRTDKGLVHKAPPITNSGFREEVGIILPFHGRYDCVLKCVESIYKLTKTNPYKIYLVDDGSPNVNFMTGFKKSNKIIPVRLNTQVGYASACEAGFAKSTEPFLVFLHSDCVVEEGNWLKSMGETLLKLQPQRVRMVGPLSNNPLGGDERQKANKNEQHPSRTVILEDTHISSCCFMVQRDLFEQTRGFLKNYPLGYWEDEEFAHRMRHFRLKQAICGTSWVRHVGEETYKEIFRKNPNLLKVIDENRERCIQDMRALSQ